LEQSNTGEVFGQTEPSDAKTVKKRYQYQCTKYYRGLRGEGKAIVFHIIVVFVGNFD